MCKGPAGQGRGSMVGPEFLKQGLFRWQAESQSHSGAQVGWSLEVPDHAGQGRAGLAGEPYLILRVRGHQPCLRSFRDRSPSLRLAASLLRSVACPPCCPGWGCWGGVLLLLLLKEPGGSSLTCPSSSDSHGGPQRPPLQPECGQKSRRGVGRGTRSGLCSE